MKRAVLITFLCLFLQFQFSCSSSSGQISVKTTNKTSKSSNKKEISKISKEGEIDDDSSMNYGAVIERICYRDDFRLISGTTAGFKRETIAPENVEMLSSISEISPETRADFIQRNLATKKLIDGYDVKFDIEPVDKKDSDENILAFAHRKNQRIKSIIGLSRIGFNEDRTQSLTYFEFYGSEHKLQKSYIVLNWDYSRGGSTVKSYKWFSAE